MLRPDVIAVACSRLSKQKIVRIDVADIQDHFGRDLSSKACGGAGPSVCPGNSRRRTLLDRRFL